jgi:rubrerythrin
MTQNIQVCRRCGIVFDLNIRKNKDCPICGAGEHTELRMNNI